MAPSSERALVQTAYQIIVTDQSGVVWDSGKVASDHSINIAYAGLELKPTTRYGWTVAAWDNNARSSVASSSFETGLQNSDP
jgi:alpha-L-rhamnosidase